MRSRGKSSYPWRGMVTVLAVFAAFGVIAGRSGAQDQDSVAFGKLTYRVYCRNCHGTNAKGDGTLAQLMKVKVSDLTQISKKNGGTFPADKVKGIIDGRQEVLAHGDREMPIWGQALTGSEDEVQTKIQQLIVFLESIQEKGTAAKKGS